ncbi:MAG: NAD(P)/FAD-dependent oxidoreductase [Nonlabens sp.]
MAKNDEKIYVVGAGVSGLTAAITLENAGYHPIILEASSKLGGRVTTDYSHNNILDTGFQVLLDDYPAAQEFLDLDALELVKFSPGSIIFFNGKRYKLGDPLRDLRFLLPTAMAAVGSIKDKFLVLSLSRELNKKSLEAIFNEPESSTLKYLEDYGFSNKIIERFFRPFYAGIFLESELSTSSRMFEFVFKMFSTGNATLPKNGIAEIPKQLASRLKSTSIQFDSRVREIRGNLIILNSGENLKADYSIVATPAGGIISNLPADHQEWHQVTTLYFTTNHEGFTEPIIGLIADQEVLVNNLHFLHDVFDHHEKVLSVSIVKQHDFNETQLIEKVKQELKIHASIEVGKLIKRCDIQKALPKLNNLNYAMHPTETQLTENIFLAGDHLSNGSLNAAMLNGKAAAQAVISKIEDGIFV